jgi:lysophospholipase L1-like esterase
MRIYLSLLIIVGFVHTLVAQKPFEDEINEFKKQDSIQFPGKGKILFVGSSSFRLWKDLQNDFPDHPLINRGFGGSTLHDILVYKEDVIKPYAPKQVVIYCGENDLASGATPQKVFDNFKALFGYIRALSPQTHIAFVSMKPSPSRENILSQVREGNAMIKEYLDKQSRSVYIDIFTPMMSGKNTFRKELFVGDMLHMNRKGYDIWKKAILPHLQ